VPIDAGEAIDAVNRVFGRHRGFRALHAKGIVCAGRFVPAAGAGSLSRAAFLAGEDVQATFRFSNGAGNPRHADWMPDARGLAVKLYLPDGSRTDIVCVSSPRFPVRTPEAFIELVQAQEAGPLAVVKLPRFLVRHPEAVRNLPKLAPTLLPRESYAGITYHGLHAFRWLDAEGGERYVRYRLLSEFTAGRLSPLTARRRPADYLQDELRERLARQPVRFDFEVQIASPGDPVDDPSAAWPAERRRVTVGTFWITELDVQRERDGDVLVFDPTRVTDGIELSDDPVLRFRGPAYTESVARRMSG
jgi:catalase